VLSVKDDASVAATPVYEVIVVPPLTVAYLVFAPDPTVAHGPRMPLVLLDVVVMVMVLLPPLVPEVRLSMPPIYE